MPDTVTDTIRRADRMATDRSTFESHWREVQRNMYPSGDTFIEQSTPGTKSHQAVFDSTGEQASEQLAAALIGLLTSADWFELAAEDEDLNDDPDVAVWLADSTKRMLSVFRNPNLGFATASGSSPMRSARSSTGRIMLPRLSGGWMSRRPNRNASRATGQTASRSRGPVPSRAPLRARR